MKFPFLTIENVQYIRVQVLEKDLFLITFRHNVPGFNSPIVYVQQDCEDLTLYYRRIITPKDQQNHDDAVVRMLDKCLFIASTKT